jgi:hypothetical protein
MLDPKNNKIGVWYSSVHWASIKFEKDKQGPQYQPDKAQKERPMRVG